MNIFFAGIGGVGVGPLAQITRDMGYTVAGSDVEASLMTEQLEKQGVNIHVGPQDGSFLESTNSQQKIDWFVYTPAITENNPEFVMAKNLGIRMAKRPEFLAHAIEEKGLKLIAASGTHGKTTTTGMLIWVFQQLGIPVSYSIGTTISYGDSGHFDPTSEYFVYEGDEFDRSMLNFHPYLSLIPSLDYDHPDTYPAEQDYLEAFKTFAKQSQQLITWSDQHGDIYQGMENVKLLDKSSVDDNIKLAGLHNRQNATLIEVGLRQIGIDGNLADILSNFPGTDRRFEKLADNLYSDYGHHPVEIASTLKMARELSDHVVLVYQPHQNIRQHQIKDDYTDQFELADEIYWLPTYESREDPTLTMLKPEELIQKITNKEHVHVAEFNDELWQIIQTARDEGKLVLGMGAGAIDGWLRKQLKN